MSDADSVHSDSKQEPTIGTFSGERNEKGERHGRGRNLFPNGDIYDGSYGLGVRNGLGTYAFKNGAFYHGPYVNNQKQSIAGVAEKGLFIYPDGSKYYGAFSGNKRTGPGRYLYINGDAYEGEWRNDLKNGYGVYTYANGSQKKGTWLNGTLQGPGEIEHPDHIVRGNYKDGEFVMPVNITFKASGQVIETSEPRYIGTVPLPATASV